MFHVSGRKYSAARIVTCSIIALILGALQAIAFIFQVMLPMPSISIAMMVSVALFSYSGMIPAGIMIAASIGSSLYGLGMLPGLVSLVTWVVPAVITMVGISQKRPFFDQLMCSVIAAVGMIALAVVAAALYAGSDLITTIVDQMRDIFEIQKDLLWETTQSMFNSAETTVTIDDYTQMYNQIFNTFESYYDYYLLSNLLCGAIISSLVAVLWGNWLQARQGEATRDSFCGLSEWFLPVNITYGLILSFAAAYIISKTSLSVGQTVWIVVRDITKLIFTIQAFAAMDRRMRSKGAGRGRRTTVIVLIIILGMLFGNVLIISVYELLAIVGCASALFGRKGALRSRIDASKNNSNGKDR